MNSFQQIGWSDPFQGDCKTKYREFFKVEKHPKLDKPWITTKSGKVSLLDKLQQANKVVEDLENNIYPIKDINRVTHYQYQKNILQACVYLNKILI